MDFLVHLMIYLFIFLSPPGIPFLRHLLDSNCEEAHGIAPSNDVQTLAFISLAANTQNWTRHVQLDALRK